MQSIILFRWSTSETPYTYLYQHELLRSFMSQIKRTGRAPCTTNLETMKTTCMTPQQDRILVAWLPSWSRDDNVPSTRTAFFLDASGWRMGRRQNAKMMSVCALPLVFLLAAECPYVVLLRPYVDNAMTCSVLHAYTHANYLLLWLPSFVCSPWIFV